MIFEQMYTDDLERLHTYIVKAARAIKIYAEPGEKSAAFALRCEEYARLFLMEIAIFDEIAKRTKGE